MSFWNWFTIPQKFWHQRLASGQARIACEEFYYSICRLFQAAGDETTADLVAASYNRERPVSFLAPPLYRKHVRPVQEKELCMTDSANPASIFRDSNLKVTFRVTGSFKSVQNVEY